MIQTLTIVWKGEASEFTPTHELFRRIEDEVRFSRIADELRAAGRGRTAELSMSHVAWVLYCCLRHAGVAVRDPLDVQQALFAGEEVLSHQGVLVGLVNAFYSAGPQKLPKKKPEEVATPSSPSLRSRRKSKNATA